MFWSEIQDGHHLENLFGNTSEEKGHLNLILEGSIGATCRLEIAKIVQIGYPRRLGCHFENLFCTSSHKPKGQLTRNLVGSIRATCRSKIAKIIPIRNPRCLPSWKSILCLFSWAERPFGWKLGRKYQDNLLIKNMVPIRNPRWPPWPPSWKHISKYF